MADENKQNDALNKFLDRETRKDDKISKKKKLSGTKKLIIFGAAALVVVAGIICLAVFLPKNSDDEIHSDFADVSLSVDSDNEHQAQVATDENGKILQNGSGKLIEKVAADITKIDVENPSGSFTLLCETPVETDDSGEGETSSTIYTIEGLEDFELQTGVPDSIANACTNMEFLTVVSTDPNLKDYGLEQPRANAVATYSDNTKSVIYVGDEAPQSAGTYIKFGSNDTVYLVDSDTANALLLDLSGLISLDITTSASDTENNEFEQLTLSGSNFKDNIVIKPNKDEAIKSTYYITEPVKGYINETAGSDVSGGIRGLYAAEVIKVNPSDDDLSQYGLKDPYAKVEAVYPDITIKLNASAPSENSVYLMHDGGNVLYRVADSSVRWVTESVDKLKNDTVLSVNKEKLSSIVINDKGTSYTIDVKTTTDTVENEDGEEEEVTNTTASYNGDELKEEDFLTFFQNYEKMNIVDYETKSPSASPVMTITFNYSTDRDSDTISIDSGSTKCPVSLNGQPCGQIYNSYVEKFSKSLEELTGGKTVKSI